MNIISLIIEAISGAVGGNVAGAAMKENSLGTVGNSIAGILGGAFAGYDYHPQQYRRRRNSDGRRWDY
jgi:uncharacterized membrane protein YeaQ/YmgE (transglycosylase-associated protein family)